jgi:hypothetical protein
MLRRFAQNLGLVYRDDGSWRPLGMRKPPASPKDQTMNQAGETDCADGRPAA